MANRKGGGLWLSARAAATIILLGGPTLLNFGLIETNKSMADSLLVDVGLGKHVFTAAEA